jgi:hypothetical protein
VGFSLFSIGFSHAIFNAINNFGMLETYMNAAGEMIAYSELETEEQGGNGVPDDWPSIKGMSGSRSLTLHIRLSSDSFSRMSLSRLTVASDSVS